MVMEADSHAQPPSGGAPARAYLNEKVVPHLLEGMRKLSKEQPSDPLRVLGEYLLEKAKEEEGKSANETTIKQE